MGEQHKHTPGPWRFVVPPDGGNRTRQIIAAAPDSDRNAYPHTVGRWIADVRGAWGSEQMESDARLIAAAPDLLEACEAMIEEYETGKQTPAYEIREKARAAINKAHGEQAEQAAERGEG